MHIVFIVGSRYSDYGTWSILIYTELAVPGIRCNGTEWEKFFWQKCSLAYAEQRIKIFHNAADDLRKNNEEVYKETFIFIYIEN